MHIEEKYNIPKIIIEIVLTIVGALIMALGVSLFLLPNQLSSGGVAGVATITYYLLKIPMGTMILLINIPLFMIAFFKVGKSFFVKSLIGTIALSYFIDFFDKFEPLTNDRFLACIYGGILLGLGTAIILKASSSTGGSDIVSFIVKEYKPNVKVGNLIMIIDIIIVALNVVFFREIEIGLYSAIAIYLMGKMIDIIFEGVNFAKVLLIISPKYKEIAKVVGDKVNRGSTGIYSKGMYTNDDKMTLLCVGSRQESYRIERIAKKIDKSAFIIVLNSREVLGRGFKQ